MSETSKIFKGNIANEVDYTQIAISILKNIPIYYDTNKIWYCYDKKEYQWKQVDEIEMINNITQEFTIAGIYQTNIKSWLLNALQLESRKNRPQQLDKAQIQFKDTIIDLYTGYSRKATSKDFTINPIPHTLGIGKATPMIDALIESWVREEDVEKVHEWIAYCMLPEYTIQRVACLTGGGRNGKSTFIKLLKKIIGTNNISAGDLQSTFIDRFGLTDLHNKLCLFMGETNFDRLTKTDKFKGATGGDELKVEYKGGTAFPYVNYAKVTIASNSLPITDDKTDAFYRRWLIIDFPNKFEEQADPIKKITEEEIEDYCAKSIDTLKRLLIKTGFTNEGTIDERREKYEKISNPLNTYLKEEILEHTDSYTPKKVFAYQFKQWQREHNYRTFTDREIGKQMLDHYDMGWRDGERVWLGIQFKHDVLNTRSTINTTR